MDTGVDGIHPDIAPNFDTQAVAQLHHRHARHRRRRASTPSCVDPVDEDDNGHGTHVAGTIAAAAQRLRRQRRRARTSAWSTSARGQDSGFFFLGPTRQRADLRRRRRHRRGQHVVLRRPVALQLQRRRTGGHPGAGGRAGRHHRGDEPRPRLRAPQGRHPGRGGSATTTRTWPTRAPTPPARTTGEHRARAHDRQRHLPRPADRGPARARRLLARPVGQEGRLLQLRHRAASGEVEVSAPGGWFRDGFGTAAYRTNEQPDPLHGAAATCCRRTGQVDADGNITPAGAAIGVQEVPCKAKGRRCGYYQFLQGTSMASPHAAGVAALVVSAHGHKDVATAAGPDLGPGFGGGSAGLDRDRPRAARGRGAELRARGRSASSTPTATGRRLQRLLRGTASLTRLGLSSIRALQLSVRRRPTGRRRTRTSGPIGLAWLGERLMF